jgi:hypothetical protein
MKRSSILERQRTDTGPKVLASGPGVWVVWGERREAKGKNQKVENRK